MTLYHLRSLLIIFFCCFSLTHLSGQEENFAQNGPDFSEEPVIFSLLAEESSFKAGHPLWLSVQMNMQPGWHSYWKNPGASGMPIQIDWNLPEGFTVEEIQWPCPKRFDQSGLVGYGYEENATLLIRLKPSDSTSHLTKATIGAEIRWLVCSDAYCVPGESELSIDLPISAATPTSNEKHSNHFAKARQALPKKTWQLQAKEANHLIEIQLQAPQSPLPQFQTATFFPESKNSIDEKIELTLTSVAGQSGNYVVILKEHETAQIGTLKGVLVLHTVDKALSNAEAIEVDIPVESNRSDEFIGLADPRIGKGILAPTVKQPPLQPNEFEGGLGLALLFAFLGGLILNLMPCVFPVISFKILSFVNMSGKSRSTTFQHGAAFSLGVLVSFWLFAGVLLLLTSLGHDAGWGFQLQQPLFVGFLAGLLLIFALSLFGIFEFGTSMTAIAGDAQQKVGHSTSALVGSFFSGMLATALATPCTGPFMAPALGFAATLPPAAALTIFTALGLGMASPYLLLAAYPSLLRFLPKPGPWMITFKELMGFFMLATVLWLMSVFGSLKSTEGLMLLLVGFFILTIAAWVYGHFCLPSLSKRKNVIGVLLASLLGIMGIAVVSFAGSSMVADAPKITHDGWEDFSTERLTALRKAGKPVFIDFTAKWCLVCQANHLILSTAEVEEKLTEFNVVKMKADWTRSDPEITAMLRKFGRNGVPLYILYGNDPSEQPQILPQVLTPGIVVEAIKNI